MSYLPCQNPNCKSYGQPHPNCKCHGGFAEGGDVSFCSSANNHEAGCEYFKDGGDVSADPDFIPDDKFDPNNHPSANFITDEKEDKNKANQDTANTLTAGVEGFNRGLTFGASDAAGLEGLGPNANFGSAGFFPPDTGAPEPKETPLAERQKNLAQRQEESPVASTLGQAAGATTAVLAGNAVGEAALGLNSGIAALPKWGKFGANVLKGAIESGAIQGGDEVSKAMLGKGDPEAPVASALSNMGVAGLIGGGVNAALGLGGIGLKSIADSKIGHQASQFIHDFGNRWNENLLDIKSTPINPGAKAADALYHEGIPKIGSKLAATAAGAALGHASGTPGGELVGAMITEPFAKKMMPLFEKVVGRPIKKYAIAAALKVLSSDNPEAMGEALDYAARVNRGNNLMKNTVDSLFTVGPQKVYENEASEAEQEKLKKFVEDGGMTSQMQNSLQNSQAPAPNFAEGGMVHNQPMPDNSRTNLSTVYPEHNSMIQAARGRVYNYLNTIRPQKGAAKLPFDHEPDTKHQTKDYTKAVKLAIHPLGILNHIKDGSLAPSDLKHLTSMYPEVYSQLSKKLTEKITEHQLNEERPPYKVRQALSLFLGSPLDSSFTPSGIQAAQNVFAQQKVQTQAQAPASKINKLSKVSKSYQTSSQAAESRQITEG